MTKLNYLQDLHYRRECEYVRGVERLTHGSSTEFWEPIEERVREEYGCSLSAFVLHEHHFNEEKSINELAQYLGVSRQSLFGLIGKLHLPIRNKKESYTERMFQKISEGYSKRMMEKSERRKFSEDYLKKSGKTRPSDSILIRQYEDLGAVKTARVWRISKNIIYNWLRDANVELRKNSLRKGKTLEEIYGADRARKIRGRMSDGMRTYWENRIV